MALTQFLISSKCPNDAKRGSSSEPYWVLNAGKKINVRQPCMKRKKEKRFNYDTHLIKLWCFLSPAMSRK